MMNTLRYYPAHSDALVAGAEKASNLPSDSPPSTSHLLTSISLRLLTPCRAVVTEINRNISATLRSTGPAVLAQQDMLTQTITALGSLVTRSHPCQQDLGDEEDEQEVEGGSAEYDWLVIDTALDVIIGLSVAMGPNFSELWKVFEKPIMKFASSQESIERSTAVGVIAECIANMGAGVSPFTPKLLTLLVHRLSDEDNETKSNAAYATGQLISNSTNSQAYLPQYNGILAKLEPMLHIKESRILDNAAGCVCRMIMKHADRVPVSEVLPALVELLPLKEDYEENKPVYECIYKLCESPLPQRLGGMMLMGTDDDHDPTIQALTPKLIPVFAQVLGPPEEQLEAETRALLTNAVKMLAKAQPALFQGHEDLVRLVQAS
jgi:importin-4